MSAEEEVKYGETLRRFTSSVDENKLALDIAMLRSKIRTLFAFDSNVEFTMTYVDEDGDSVTLADDDDVRDVVRQSLNPLRITVTLNNGSNGNGVSNTGGSSRAAEPINQALNAGVSELLKSVNEPLRKALESVPVELANRASSSAPALAELVEKMKAVYMSQMSASMASPSVNTESSTVKESKARVSSTEAGSSSLKKKDKHRKGTEGVKFRDVQPPPKGVDLNVPYFGYESFQTPFDATKGAGEGSSGINETTADGVEKKKEEVGSGSLNEPLLRPAAPTSGSPLVDHMNQMRQYCQDRMAAQAAQVAQVAADFKKVATDSGRSPSWTQGMLNATNQCPFTGMPLQTDSDSHGHHRHSRGHHWKRHGLDNNGIGTIFHRGVRCDGCGVHPITGPRYKSKVKEDYDLCSVCFAGMGTASDYFRIDRPMHGFRHHVPFKGFYDPSLRFPPPTLPHALRAPGSKLPRSKLDSRFIVDVNVLDGTVMAPFTPFTKIWRMRNNGSIIWPHGSQLHWIGGDRISNTLSVDVEIPADGLPVDNELDVAVDFTAPELPGRYISYWRMTAPGGQKFGQRVWVLIQVDASMTDLGETSFNLNLPPVTPIPEAANQVPPADHLFSGENSSGVINWEGTSSDSQPKDHELNFPINDSLIIDNGGVSSPMPTLSSPVGPVAPPVSSVFNSTEVENALASLQAGPEVSSRLYPTIGVDSSVEPINYPTVDYSVIPPPVITEYVPASPNAYTSPPVMNDSVPSVLKAYPSPPVMDSGVPSGVSAIPSPSVPVVQTTGPSAQEVSDDQEEALVKDLADMGFKQLDLNKEVLRLNNYDLEKSIDSLCGVSDWDPMLDELQEMGFADDETNRRLLKKNNGSIKRVVMDLINGERA
ncbi:protein NBR1 [Tanacetum coccineum]